jgi:hypothetical protein
MLSTMMSRVAAVFMAVAVTAVVAPVGASAQVSPTERSTAGSSASAAAAKCGGSFQGISFVFRNCVNHGQLVEAQISRSGFWTKKCVGAGKTHNFGPGYNGNHSWKKRC